MTKALPWFPSDEDLEECEVGVEDVEKPLPCGLVSNKAAANISAEATTRRSEDV